MTRSSKIQTSVHVPSSTPRSIVSTPPLNVLFVFSRTQRGPRSAQRGRELALPQVSGLEDVVVDRDDEGEVLLGRLWWWVVVADGAMAWLP